MKLTVKTAFTGRLPTVYKNAETKYLANDMPVTKFSVVTGRSWKDEMSGKKRPSVTTSLPLGKGFAKLTDRLVKGTHVLVQGELTTREYGRTSAKWMYSRCSERSKPDHALRWP